MIGWRYVIIFFVSSFTFGDLRPAPGSLSVNQLEGFEKWTPKRKKFVEMALAESSRLKLGKYVFGSADPAREGFDCSGSVYYLLKRAGLKPTRSSAAQFEWLKKAGTLQEVKGRVASLDDDVFTKLKPGDLLFWEGTYRPKEGRPNKITHVQIYLGVEKGHGPVMIGSSDGRSYRGKARCGFGVFDFKLPRSTSKARFAGFGSPPDLFPETDQNADKKE